MEGLFIAIILSLVFAVSLFSFLKIYIYLYSDQKDQWLRKKLTTFLKDKYREIHGQEIGDRLKYDESLEKFDYSERLKMKQIEIYQPEAFETDYGKGMKKYRWCFNFTEPELLLYAVAEEEKIE